MPRFDLSIPAENGLMRGRTTGTCAAAAAKAAVMAMLGRRVDEVEVALPGSDFSLPVPIAGIRLDGENAWRAEVIKDAGNDPDVTHGATIFAVAKPTAEPGIFLRAAAGVGTVTQPGLRVAIGEPAINPVPRAMITRSVEEALSIAPEGEDRGLEIAIGCEGGEQLAARTFNPRLGVVGGISILGTTGIVEPMSLAAYQASVEVYIRVGLADAREAALLPGNIGLGFAAGLGLGRKQTIHISNFLGFALDTAAAVNAEYGDSLQTLWILGHPGKLAKALDGHWDTHSKVSPMATGAIARFAAEQGLPGAVALGDCNTVEAAIDLIGRDKDAQPFWLSLEQRLAETFCRRATTLPPLRVKLFDMAGTELTAGME